MYATKTLSKPAKTIGTKLTSVELKQIERLVELGQYLNVSDFLREAVREKLEAIEIIKLRDVDFKAAKKEVLGYFQQFREAFPSDAAKDLKLDLQLVHKISGELVKEKRLEAIE